MLACVVDIGSNTLKILVAELREGALVTVHSESLPVRIETAADGNITQAGMERVSQGVAELLKGAEVFGAERIRVVATSAVRDAGNKEEFVDAIHGATGKWLDVLSGDEEARLIAKGLLTDGALAGRERFLACDLGGGSLEWIEYADGEIRVAESFQLGAVRLCRRFWEGAKDPYPREVEAMVREYVRGELAGVAGKLEAPVDLVMLGGALGIVKLVLGLESDVIERGILEGFLARLRGMDLKERLAIPGMPANRADIMPVALTVVLELMQFARVDALTLSFRNLRYGCAAELLHA